jgi:hypothetical protein
MPNIGQWSVIIPVPAAFSQFSDIVKSYGFITVPQFQDNFFIAQKGEPNVKRFLKELEKNKGITEFAVFPDKKYNLGNLLVEEHELKWIFPMHTKSEADFALAHNFAFIAMPYDKPRRDYSIEWFTNFVKTHGLKSWYLGWYYRNPEKEHSLKLFDAFDTGILQYYCLMRGKSWVGWGKYREHPFLDRPTILHRSLKNFKRDLLNLSNSNHHNLLASESQKVNQP